LPVDLVPGFALDLALDLTGAFAAGLAFLSLVTMMDSWWV